MIENATISDEFGELTPPYHYLKDYVMNPVPAH
jgi:hypothetical protein